MNSQNLNQNILKASQVVGNTWPLYSFVTSNPLAGYQDMPFNKAVGFAKKYFGSKVYPEARIFALAIQKAEIDKDILRKNLIANGFKDSIESYLGFIGKSNHKPKQNKNSILDQTLTKWLSSFFDEGLAEWPMPNKEKGFFEAWKSLAKYDSDLGISNKNEIPKTSEETLKELLESYSEKEQIDIFIHHLSALPGWVGYIKHRVENNTEWQKAYPITLTDYLAVRLFMAIKLGTDIQSKKTKETEDNDLLKLQYIFLQSWESTWQRDISKSMTNQDLNASKDKTENVEAQLVFCIDTRSELIRRHVESKGNYETFGYAGFFGIATDYEDLETGVIRKSCPPILPSSYKVSETEQKNKEEEFKNLKQGFKRRHFKSYLLKRLKNMLPSAFGFVEGSGVFYGLAMVGRTILPNKYNRINNSDSIEKERVCEPKINHIAKTGKSDGISINEKVAIVKTAFDLLGWRKFAPLVIFTGHGSHTANNPFASSLDCGACAASPGRHNARLLAKLANDNEVRNVLLLEHDINIPEETIFIGAEHNTTTDEIEIFDYDVPESHSNRLKTLKYDLGLAQVSATQERLQKNENSKELALKKSQNWSETRPEWGLAKNAGFIIGSRKLTKGLNLDARCFLHSYDWKLDKEGKALEGIMQGPMVVTQWINNHYYFSTVDNDTFGGGTKITHNVIGKFGVVQGNGGDLKTGLPLQSVNTTDSEIYHKPLRLSVMIHAPKTRVSEILCNNDSLKNLLDNEWIYLMVMDPLNSNEIVRYEKNLNWKPVENNKVKFNNNTVEEVFA